MGVLLEDIERIEVLRGSNSAAYGANAMFGVINVITRHTADTHGSEISVTSGEGGIKDNMARIGWGSDVASFRLSTGRRSDSGYGNAYDDKIASQLHFRSDMRPAADQDLMFSAGVTQLSSGNGFASSLGGNPARTNGWDDFYLQGQWRRQLSATDEVKLSANFEEETNHDAFVYALDPSVIISSSGRARRANLELQHQLGINNELRAVWGIGYKYEDVVSPALYATENVLSVHEERLFGNLEWRPHEQWLINAGGFWGQHSWVGSHFSPRLMANFHATPDHTFRAGVTDSVRTPTLFELAADVRVYPKNLPPFSTLNAPAILAVATGQTTQENLHTQEIGYFGNFRNWRMTVDVRGYIEKMKDTITDGLNTVPWFIHPVTHTLVTTTVPDYVNGAGFKIRGLEYQLRWKPLNDTEILLNQTFETLIWDDRAADKNHSLPPTHSTTLALFQKLPLNLDLTVMLSSIGAMTWGGQADSLPSRRRIDARLAMPFRVGSAKAEAAFAVQAASGRYPEYFSSQNLVVERRAFGTLRFEF